MATRRDAQDPPRARLLLPQPRAEACSYTNICEQCDNFTTSIEFVPTLESQLTDVTALREDAEARGWHTEVARHARVTSNLTRHLDRLAHSETPSGTT